MANKKYFEDIKTPDLEALTAELVNSFSEYTRFTNGRVMFGGLPLLIFTPDKPNTARTISPVYFDHEQTGELYVIVFLPNDGTGDVNTYKLDQLIVHKNLSFKDKPERVYPRKKKCESEVLFPFFSAGRNYLQKGFVSLDVLTTNVKKQPPTIVREFSLGVSLGAFAAAEGKDLELEPYFQFTVDGEDSDRFGDPHAIFYNGKLSSDRIQVVGFLELLRSSSAYRFFKESISQTPQL